MTENEFILNDRIQKIKSINETYDLENNAYVSFSGGKDSTVIHHLIDEALPGNGIPRVFLNTGIEYKFIVQFCKEMAESDSRFVIYNVGKNITKTLRKVGYPFKSKEHSQKVFQWRNGLRCKSHRRYFRQEPSNFQQCPKSLMYQIEEPYTLPISHKCCYEFKKKPIQDYMKTSGRYITITGMMREEEGQRNRINCILMDNKGKLKKFHPMAVISKEWEDWYIRSRNIKLCGLYYPPYNFKRTGCKGCPFNLNLQDDLNILSVYFPDERKQCEMIWKPVYEEYRKTGRLKMYPNLFDIYD